jgi:hypothetical protein
MRFVRSRVIQHFKFPVRHVCTTTPIGIYCSLTSFFILSQYKKKTHALYGVGLQKVNIDLNVITFLKIPPMLGALTQAAAICGRPPLLELFSMLSDRRR